jgi:hypothetical protein
MTLNPQHIGMFSIARAVGGSHRMSVPLPPRPGPSTALPPTPMGPYSECSATTPTATFKPTHRNSLARHALRLSLSQPAASLQVQAQLSPHATTGFNTPSTWSSSCSHSWSTSVAPKTFDLYSTLPPHKSAPTLTLQELPRPARPRCATTCGTAAQRLRPQH